MPGLNPTFQTGPRTYEVSEAVKGGQVVESSSATSLTKLPVVKVGTADSIKTMGVAFRDAVPNSARAGFEDGVTSYPGGFVTTDISVPDDTVAVYNDCWVKVQFTGACAERQGIKAAAGGAVAPWVDGTDSPARRIGWCAQVGGVASAGVGLARILV